jgi:serine/threonine protein kinase
MPSEVRVATSNLDNTQFAVKIIDRRTTPNLESVFRETQAFAKITQHPNIIKYHEVLHKSVYSYIILEFAPDFVSMAEFLQKEGRLSESMAYRIFVQRSYA